MTGLATANTEGDPIVALGGAVALEDRLKKIHQTLDSVSLCKPVTKYSVEVDSPAAVAEVMENAFRAAEEERPGAAFVSLPIDVMGAPAQCEAIKPGASPRLGAADLGRDSRSIEAHQQGTKARRTAGHACQPAENIAAIQQLLSDGKLPVVGTFQAAGAVSLIEYPNFAGRVWQTNNLPGDRVLAAATWSSPSATIPSSTGLPHGIAAIHARSFISTLRKQTSITAITRPWNSSARLARPLLRWRVSSNTPRLILT